MEDFLANTFGITISINTWRIFNIQNAFYDLLFRDGGTKFGERVPKSVLRSGVKAGLATGGYATMGKYMLGEQGKEFGLVDEIGDENDARLLAIKFANLDEKTKAITFGKSKKKFLGLIPGGKLIHNLLNAINLEFEGNGHILWLYKPWDLKMNLIIYVH